MRPRKRSAKTTVRLSPPVKFKEGDAIVRVSPGWAGDQDRGILIFSTDGWLTICFVNHEEDSLDLSGIRWAPLSAHYRLATTEERRQILLSMLGKEFGKHRGPGYFAKWEAKLKTVIAPAIAAALGAEEGVQNE